MAKSSFLLFTPLALLLLLGQSAVALDFCVGDLSAELTPSGYPCRNPKAVTVSDFAFSGLAAAANVKNAIMAAVTPAFASQFPALNGLGISAARLDLAPNGVIPLHIHPAANEVLLVTQGQICAGFIDTNNKVFSKTLNAGELMVFPRGLLHYQINVGSSAAVGFPFFSSPLPGLQIVPLALFQGDIPSAVIEKTTFLADAEVKRLKNFFGGTN